MLKPPVDTCEVVARHAGVVVAWFGISKGDGVYGEHGGVAGIGKVI